MGLSLVTVFLSNPVLNVPAVLLLKPVLSSYPTRLRAGLMANLIVAAIASRRNVGLKLRENSKAGVIITVVTPAISIGWITVFISS